MITSFLKFGRDIAILFGSCSVVTGRVDLTIDSRVLNKLHQLSDLSSFLIASCMSSLRQEVRPISLS
jgi:hypothetical protein